MLDSSEWQAQYEAVVALFGDIGVAHWSTALAAGGVCSSTYYQELCNQQQRQPSPWVDLGPTHEDINTNSLHLPVIRRSLGNGARDQIILESGEACPFLWDEITWPIVTGVTICARLTEIYHTYRPNKISDVPALLSEWAGNVEQLISQVEEKYLPQEQPAAAVAQQQLRFSRFIGMALTYINVGGPGCITAVTATATAAAVEVEPEPDSQETEWPSALVGISIPEGMPPTLPQAAIMAADADVADDDDPDNCSGGGGDEQEDNADDEDCILVEGSSESTATTGAFPYNP